MQCLTANMKCLTNLINNTLLDNLTIDAIIELQIKRTKKYAVILWVLKWKIHISHGPKRNVREGCSSKHLKSKTKPLTELWSHLQVMLVLVILSWPILRIQYVNLIMNFVDAVNSPMLTVNHRNKYL